MIVRNRRNESDVQISEELTELLAKSQEMERRLDQLKRRGTSLRSKRKKERVFYLLKKGHTKR